MGNFRPLDQEKWSDLGPWMRPRAPWGAQSSTQPGTAALGFRPGQPLGRSAWSWRARLAAKALLGSSSMPACFVFLPSFTPFSN
ncbi:hypothetical protein TIFTF001_016346 [Ficus carica]|uniref:Uncharacterized protein n=1 Tax=Ficus carica TaxID=3494 RepID=A0AA88A650_FICCA|nr:hypothetical protein TIFTF001_016346 [Ficus carica]